MRIRVGGKSICFDNDNVFDNLTDNFNSDNSFKSPIISSILNSKVAKTMKGRKKHKGLEIQSSSVVFIGSNLMQFLISGEISSEWYRDQWGVSN